MTPEEQKAADEKAAQVAKEQAAKDQAAKDQAAAKAPHEQDSHATPAERARVAEADANVKVTINDPNSTEAIKEQHQRVDAELAKRNEENAEGHEKNMEKIEAAAHEAKARGEHADDHRAGHVPTGKQINHNTPRVLADGSKVWD